MILNFSLQELFIKVIHNNKYLKESYDTIFPHTKYELHNIINNIIYILQSGVSFRKYNGDIPWKSLLYHFNRFIYYDIFKKAYSCLLNKYFKITVRFT